MSNVPPSDGGGFPSFPDEPSGPGGPAGFPPAPGAPGASTPPPPPGAPGTPPPAYAQPTGYPPAPPPGYPGYGQTPGYPPAGAMVKGPRPDVKVGGILCVVGAVLALIGVFLPWASDGGESLDGMDDFYWLDGFTRYEVDQPGIAAIIGAVITIGLGVTLIVAGRVLAVAIIAIVAGAAGAVAGLIFFGFSAAFADYWDADLGIGAIIQPIAPLISLVGGIVATAKRRRMVPAGAYGAPPPTAGASAPPPPPGGYPQG